MMRYPKCAPVPWDGAVIFLIISLSILPLAARISGASAISGLSGDTGRTPEQWAVVYIDGVEADRVVLSSFPGDQFGNQSGLNSNGELSDGKPETRIYQNNGYQIQAVFRPDGEAGVQVIHADCPTQVCVHTGRIAHTGQVIVCLPSRIVIRLEAGPEQYQEQNKNKNQDQNQTDSNEPDIILG